MAKKQLSELNDAELRDELIAGKDELMKLRFQRVTGKLENHARIGQVKKDVARVLTELRAREITAAEALEKS
jgi:large subunit ribosomal protein L29